MLMFTPGTGSFVSCGAVVFAAFGGGDVPIGSGFELAGFATGESVGIASLGLMASGKLRAAFELKPPAFGLGVGVIPMGVERPMGTVPGGLCGVEGTRRGKEVRIVRSACSTNKIDPTSAASVARPRKMRRRVEGSDFSEGRCKVASGSNGAPADADFPSSSLGDSVAVADSKTTSEEDASLIISITPMYFEAASIPGHFRGISASLATAAGLPNVASCEIRRAMRGEPAGPTHRKGVIGPIPSGVS